MFLKYCTKIDSYKNFFLNIDKKNSSCYSYDKLLYVFKFPFINQL